MARPLLSPTARSTLLAFGLVVAAGACSSSGDAEPTAPPSTSPPSTLMVIETTSSAEVSSSSDAPSTSDAPTTTRPRVTSTTSTTSTTVAPTTVVPETVPVTAAPAAPAPLRGDGIADQAFGTDAETAIAGMTAVFGAPTADTGWADPLSISTCAGTQVRRVDWGTLSLLFGDESAVLQGTPHLFAWSYGNVAELGGAPAGLVTAEGIGLGASVAQLRAAYPGLVVNPGEQGLLEANFVVDGNRSGLVTGDADADTVTVLFGGQFCG